MIRAIIDLKTSISLYGFWDGLKTYEGWCRLKINPHMPPGPGDEMLTWWGEIAERVDRVQLSARYKHKIGAYTIRREADTWCDENCKSKWIFHYQPWLDYGPFYRFKDETDAMAIKLRWL